MTNARIILNEVKLSRSIFSILYLISLFTKCSVVEGSRITSLYAVIYICCYSELSATESKNLT